MVRWVHSLTYRFDAVSQIGVRGPAGYFGLPADGGGWPDAALFGYSDLSVTMGSTRVARQAGTSVATMPTINMIAATALKVPGSC